MEITLGTTINVTIELYCKSCGESLNGAVSATFFADSGMIDVEICTQCLESAKESAYAKGLKDGTPTPNIWGKK